MAGTPPPNLFDDDLFCEGKYGGVFRITANGTLPAEGSHFPEYGNAYSAPVIMFVGLHMLLFNSHESGLLKVIAGLIFANGVFSFSYHYTGYLVLKEADGLTMVDAVWLSAGLMLEELLEALLSGRDHTDGTCSRRRCLRAFCWCTVVIVPYLVTIAKRPPFREWLGGAERAEAVFHVAFPLPLLIILVSIIVTANCTNENRIWDRFQPKMNKKTQLPEGCYCFVGYTGVGTADHSTRDGVASESYGQRLRRVALGHFAFGMFLALLGITAWILTETLCDSTPAFRVFPGHLLFHILLCVGILHISIYPSLLRADNFRATPSRIR